MCLKSGRTGGNVLKKGLDKYATFTWGTGDFSQTSMDPGLSTDQNERREWNYTSKQELWQSRQ